MILYCSHCCPNISHYFLLLGIYLLWNLHISMHISPIFLLFLNFTIIYLCNSDAVSRELLLVILLGWGGIFFFLWKEVGGINSVNIMCLSVFKNPVICRSNSLLLTQNYPSLCSKMENGFTEMIVAIMKSSLYRLTQTFQTVLWK